MIGIRLADRSVFQVFSDERPGKRRVILSTSHEGQNRVEIPVVRSRRDDDVGALPITIGTLRLEDLTVLPQTAPEIELTLDLQASGTLSVAAMDTGSRNAESISINLAQATAEAAYAVPESLTSLPGSATPQRRRLWPVTLILLVLIILFAGVLWLAFGRGDRTGEAEGPRSDVTTDSPSDGETTQEPGAPGVADEPDVATDRAVGGAETRPRDGLAESAPPSEAAPDSAPPVGSIEYRIRRGDTLWDLANSFYGNPWLYPTLAETNRILNPDLIYAEDKITVPGDPEPSR
jgi:nucleoid-associated protein YgaU